MIPDFSERKFIGLSLRRQHKKCSEILYRIYNKLIAGEDVTKEAAFYKSLRSLMKDPIDFEMRPQFVSDCYHLHLKEAGIYKKEHSLLPKVAAGDRESACEPWPIDVYLDNIRSAHNVGSILRTTEALGLGTVYFSGNTPFIDNTQVQNTSMGTYDRVPCFANRPLSTLKQPIIVLETVEEALSIYEFIFPASFTLILGNEEYGCSDAALQSGNYFIRIPLRGRKNSLNVANAFALVAGEIARQKTDLFREVT